ncbi:basic salivary proline-rich protein 2-like [Sapajus apella]|uniref:Basic salivary proline-rich protein 2-like n=1 Tax=Sapajus apella TaxID=9515 RepID=A0A6J3JSC6_SAPAP|nr:basic salivary proline-rich protein 2-like [Sapajus apella]
MFLDPAVAGAAGRAVGRSPRGGVAGLEPRRITGEGRGEAESLPGGERRGRGQRRGPAGGSGGVRLGGRREARSAPPRPGVPGPPPPAEPTAARGLLELGGPQARVLYRARGTAAAAGRARRGRGQNAAPAGVSRQRRPPAGGRQAPPGLPLAAANFFPPREGAGGLGAGPAAGAAWSAWPQWVPPSGGGKARLSSSGAAQSEIPGAFSVAGILHPQTCLSLPCSPRLTCGAFSSHLRFCAGRGNCKMPEYRNRPCGPACLQRVLPARRRGLGACVPSVAAPARLHVESRWGWGQPRGRPPRQSRPRSPGSFLRPLPAQAQ